MGFLEAIQSCFKKYVGFSGRAPRSEYWFFFLFNIILSIFANVIDLQVLKGQPIASVVVLLATLLPGLAVAVRRLHDKDKSGWWLLLLLIPLVGFIVLLVWFCGAGTQGENRFGPNPLPASAVQKQAF